MRMVCSFQYHFDMLARDGNVGPEGARGQPIAHHVHESLESGNIGRELREIVHAFSRSAGRFRYDSGPVPAYYPAVIRNEAHFYARQATCTAP